MSLPNPPIPPIQLEWVGSFKKQDKAQDFIWITGDLKLRIQPKQPKGHRDKQNMKPTEWVVTQCNNESPNYILIDGAYKLYIQQNPKQVEDYTMNMLSDGRTYGLSRKVNHLQFDDSPEEPSSSTQIEWVDRGTTTNNVDNAAEGRFWLCGTHSIFIGPKFSWAKEIIRSQKLPVWIVDPTCTSSDFFMFNGYKMHIQLRDKPVIVLPVPDHMTSLDTSAEFTDEHLMSQTLEYGNRMINPVTRMTHRLTDDQLSRRQKILSDAYPEKVHIFRYGKPRNDFPAEHLVSGSELDQQAKVDFLDSLDSLD